MSYTSRKLIYLFAVINFNLYVVQYLTEKLAAVPVYGFGYIYEIFILALFMPFTRFLKYYLL